MWRDLEIRRLRTGVEGIDRLIQGGIPEGFFVAVTGEPGCGKTIFSIHFIYQGVIDGDKSIYVTTEESRESIIRQASQFSMDFEKAIDEGKLIVIDALMGREDKWSLQSLDIEALVGKIIEAKKELGYGRARVAIDSISAFWLDKPA
ncbi:MAG: ATPase domain-containing protein, partial [Nitrososphaerota archaeon]